MCENNCNAEALAEINAKLDLIINTVSETIGGLANNPMFKAFLR